ncbi:uncharacterized protein LOC101851277 [Aplysia californica]|uniref:Uncharacterized protein LOC101851277 n=1 Tax=Aplysia californica TaxID=6500 RepID=A0ABM1A3E9_APLCA|nr:uncharacterized protein LOC101851277 [Aplysia californica]XP_035826556.1 uncharacterized protein LOC101851277 [Aplysia californica]
MKNDVNYFLERIGMLKYQEIFHAKGFDLETDVVHLTCVDLEESLMISSKWDRALIIKHAQHYQPSPQLQLNEWLHSNYLDHYFESFVRSELTDLKAIAQLQLPNEELYDELEIVMPGHRKRLERAVRKLWQDQAKSEGAELPITQGWWGKPECLPQAKFDFLCVRAALFSGKERQNKVHVDFMVDSGSDVSTVQEDTLKQLNLELLGSVYSCGIHGGSHTNLYKARLAVGTQEMDIEIMASNYDSLGSRVVRNFRHVIDGQKHIWLKGNYRDSLPAVLPLPAPLSVPVSRAKDGAEPNAGSKVSPPDGKSLSIGQSLQDGDVGKHQGIAGSALGEDVDMSRVQQNESCLRSENASTVLTTLGATEKKTHGSVDLTTGIHNSGIAHAGKNGTLSISVSDSNNKRQLDEVSNNVMIVDRNFSSSSLSDESTSADSGLTSATSKGKRTLSPNCQDKKRKKTSLLDYKRLEGQGALFDHPVPLTEQERKGVGDAPAQISMKKSVEDFSSPTTTQASSSSSVFCCNASNNASNEPNAKSNSCNNSHQDRVSLKNIVPASLRDTDDDIDHMDPSNVSINNNTCEDILTVWEPRPFGERDEHIADDIIHISYGDDNDPEEDEIKHPSSHLHSSYSSSTSQEMRSMLPQRPNDIVIVSLEQLEDSQSSLTQNFS